MHNVSDDPADPDGRFALERQNERLYAATLSIIIQHIVTLPKYGHVELNICRPHTTDIL